KSGTSMTSEQGSQLTCSDHDVCPGPRSIVRPSHTSVYPVSADPPSFGAVHVTVLVTNGGDWFVEACTFVGAAGTVAGAGTVTLLLTDEEAVWPCQRASTVNV